MVNDSLTKVNDRKNFYWRKPHILPGVKLNF